MTIASVPIGSLVCQAIAPGQNGCRNWTEAEKAYIRIAPALKENLLKSLNSGDLAHWTSDNIHFLRSIS